MTDQKPPSKTRAESIVDFGKVTAAIMTILGLPSATVAGWQAYSAWQKQQVQIGIEQAAAADRAKQREQQIAQLFDQFATSDARLQQASAALSETTDQLRTLANTQQVILRRIDAFEKNANAVDLTPAIEFASFGNTISDGSIGQSVSMQWTFTKLRECGAPKLDMMFENGAQVLHRFINASILDSQARGVNLEADPTRRQTIRYKAWIPTNDGVTPGRAFGWLNLTYPDQCPELPPIQSPKVVFEILP